MAFRLRLAARRLLSTARAAPLGPNASPDERAARGIETWDRVTRRRALRRSLDDLGAPTFAEGLRERGLALPRRPGLPETLQVNIGLTCNLACSHCHVESSPSRAETMRPETAKRVLELLAASPSIRTLDITGGAPEMHAAFKPLVLGARALGLRVIDRCNLTILQRPGMEGMASFLREHCVDVVASLPCYTEANVEKQRGSGVFLDSIKSLQQLNALGYAKGGSRGAAAAPGGGAKPLAGAAAAGAEAGAVAGPRLDLVYNPGGAFLPPAQASLEADYRAKLGADFQIEFDSLFCMANMPIKRFADELRDEGKLAEYMQLLVGSFKPANLDGVMCRTMVHVSFDGSISDCDFNYALGMHPPNPKVRSVHSLTSSFAELADEPISFDRHCWGCVAGSGSSCGGAL